MAHSFTHKIGPHPYDLYIIFEKDDDNLSATLGYSGSPSASGTSYKLDKGAKVELTVRVSDDDIVFDPDPGTHSDDEADPPQPMCYGHCPPYQIACVSGMVGLCDNNNDLVCGPGGPGDVGDGGEE